MGDRGNSRHTVSISHNSISQSRTSCDNVFVLMIRSQVKVLAEANPLIHQTQNPLNLLGPLLFPQGSSNLPMEQMGKLMAGAGAGAVGGSDLSPAVMTQLKQEQLTQLQKQYPHLEKELQYLVQQQGGAAEAIGAAGSHIMITAAWCGSSRGYRGGR